MRHRVAGRNLGRTMSHRNALFRNLITALFQHGHIQTTEAKAKAIRGDAERLITIARRANREDAASLVHARREVAKIVRDENTATKIFNELATKYQGRQGGYTRIMKLGARQGDAAPMVLLELVDLE